MGSERTLTSPANEITIEITLAKIGRWMKNREITVPPQTGSAAIPAQDRAPESAHLRRRPGP